MSFVTSLALAGLLAVPTTAFWRLPCASPLVQERADPIVNPGAVSGHLHTIMGGNGFDFQMDYNSTQASTCTSCTVHGDFSNYWTPVLYFQHQDGSFEKVDQVGGATVYYLQRGGPNERLEAFPEGFRMIAGNPFKRTGGDDFASQAISYNCLNYNGPAEPETGAFPTHNCPNGIRSQVFFPSCWDGKNLDSADHKSHMSYPVDAYNSGSCPSTHPVHLISIFYEIIWDTNKFADQWHGSSQPFVWSMGDPTGYGFHGDFVNGWDVDLLQKAVDECTNLSGRVEDCPAFTLYPTSTAQGCRLASKLDETIDGVLAQLPGCNRVQVGPPAAVPVAADQCKAVSTIASAASVADEFFTDLTQQGWSYTGCATDNYYARSLTAASTSSDNMTNEACATFCSAKGFSVAATEYSRECYCGDSFPQDRLPAPGVVGDCNMPCAGDKSEWCGGAALMSLYQKCDGKGSCVNAQLAPRSASPSAAASGSASLATSALSDSASSSTSASALIPTSASASLPSSASLIKGAASAISPPSAAVSQVTNAGSPDSDSDSDDDNNKNIKMAWEGWKRHIDVHPRAHRVHGKRRARGW